MFVFRLGGYRLPFSLIELHSFDYTHIHRTLYTKWEEPMHLRLCLPCMPPTRLRIANDNNKVLGHG
jgi:hypothetical protein